MRIEEGQLVTLDDNKEYMVLKALEYNNTRYIYLMTSSKPIEVSFVKEEIIDNDLTLVPISDTELVEIIPLFEN